MTRCGGPPIVAAVALDPRTPVIVGVGQFLWRAQGLEDAMEPIALMEQAVRNAVADAGLAALPPAVGSIRVINSLSWRYGDPAALLAARLGTTAAEHAVTHSGGNVPQSIVNRTALDIAAGLDLAVIVGGEAWRTRTRAKREGARLDWDTSARDRPPPVVLGDELRDVPSGRGRPRRPAARAGVSDVRDGRPRRRRA